VDLDLARHVVRNAYRSVSELGQLIDLLREHCSDEEYATYLRAIATASASIQLELVNRLTSAHPCLEEEIEAGIAKYGRYL
jgi:Zn-finger domain-containing protein